MLLSSRRKWWAQVVFEHCMYVCMYLLIGKEQSAQKRPYWGEDGIKGKFISKHMSLKVV